MTIQITAALVDKVRAIAVRAGHEIMAVYNSDFAVDRKGDTSPVTEADRRAEELILGALRTEIGAEAGGPFPILAEEEVSAGRVPEIGEGPFWLVDPLDGTKQFINRQGEFTVNIALIEGGLPILGVVHTPVGPATYWGSPLGAFADLGNGGPQPISCRPFPDGPIVAVASRSHRTPETDTYLAQYQLAEAISSGSSIKFCLVASGRADLYPRMGRTMEWDTAAGHAVVRFAGGTVEDLQGNELRYGKPGHDNPHFVVKGKRQER